MSLYLKRLKGQRINVGIMSPQVFANEIYNPVFAYLNMQYNLVSSGESPRDVHIQIARDDSEENWNVYWNTAMQQLQAFYEIVNGIKNNEYSSNDPEVVQNLYQTGFACSRALCEDYLRMYYLYLLVRSELTFGTRGSALNDPSSAYFSPLDYLIVWPPWKNWGKSKWEIELEKENERQIARWKLKTYEEGRKKIFNEEVNNRVNDYRKAEAVRQAGGMVIK